MSMFSVLRGQLVCAAAQADNPVYPGLDRHSAWPLCSMELVDLMPMASVALYFLSGSAAGAALTYALCGKIEARSPHETVDMPSVLEKLQSVGSIPKGGLSREGSFNIPALVRSAADAFKRCSTAVVHTTSQSQAASAQKVGL